MEAGADVKIDATVQMPAEQLIEEQMTKYLVGRWLFSCVVVFL